MRAGCSRERPAARRATGKAAPQDALAGGPARRWPRGLAQAAITIAYPLVILSAWHWDAPRYIGGALFALLWLQRWVGIGLVAMSLRRLTALDWWVAGVLSCASAAIVLTNSPLLLRLYPALVNGGLLLAFGATLRHGPSMIEKFARLRKPELGLPAVRYTRRVTQVWCAFFALNGIFSAYTALCWTRAAWSLYNGALVYGLIGALLAGELAWRHWFVLPHAERSEAA